MKGVETNSMITNDHKNLLQKALLILGLIYLTGCETPEQRIARETQFNGIPLSEVTGIIGQPSLQSVEKAVWNYDNSYINQVPIYHHINGELLLVGFRRDRIRVSCTYTATLRAGQVINSSYVGNSCARFAPKLESQTKL